MKLLRTAVPLVLIVGVSAAMLGVGSAAAMSCESTCNQIRRACRSVAMSSLKVAYADCDSARDTCRNDCDLNAEQCPITCETDYNTCVGSGGTGCSETRDACLADCASCIPNCNADRVACRDAAKLARAEANLLCDAARESCDTICVDPIDPDCVRACRVGSSGCQRDAKRAEKTCGAACSGGTDNRACKRDCRRQKNADLMQCSNAEVLCIGQCAGILP